MPNEIKLSLTEFLELFDFNYKKENGVYRLIDNQGGNYGDIEAERFESIADIVNRLDFYYRDYLEGSLIDWHGFDMEEYTYEDLYNYAKSKNLYHTDYLYCILHPEAITDSYTRRLYYVEIWDKDTGDTIVQSEWFKTKDQAKDWKNKIFFIHHKYDKCILYAECQLNEDGSIEEYDIIGSVDE